MSKRLDPKLWAAVVDELVKRDGASCQYCKQPLPQPLRNHSVPKREWTSINHIDGNKQDYRLQNLNLMHNGCNVSSFHDLNRKARLVMLLSGKQPLPQPFEQPFVSGERERLSGLSTSELQAMLPAFRIVPREQDAYSNRKNSECMPLYFRVVFSRVLSGALKGIGYTYDQLNNYGAMQVGEVPNTTGRYLNMLLSESGPFEPHPQEKTNVEIVVPRCQEYAYLTPDELLEIFPPQGRRMVDPKREKTLIEEAERRMAAAQEQIAAGLKEGA